jgi:hypothetical protein
VENSCSGTLTASFSRDNVTGLKSIISNPFSGEPGPVWTDAVVGVFTVVIVLPPKNFPGMAESTILSRSFADQGVKLRIRKEARNMM